MKKFAWVLGALVVLAVQGCSAESRGTAKELGNDMKRDINAGAQKVDRAVEDAVD
jgi:hypothetical protein